MGYSVNRYFKPAVYAPMNTAVQYPFQEMFTAARMKQANTPKLEYTDKDAAGAEGFRLATGDFIPLDDREIASNVQSQLDGKMSSMSTAIANGTMNPQEYGYLAKQMTTAYDQTYSPNGILGKLDKNKQGIEALEKTRAAAKDLNVSPWRAFAIDEHLLAYKQGEIAEINPNIGVDEIVDRTEEINKMLTHMSPEGKAWAQPGNEDSPYIRTGSVTEVSPQKVKDIFVAWFDNSRMKSDMLQERNYNIMTGKMTEEQANQNFDDQYKNLLDQSFKAVSRTATAGLSGDAYARGLADQKKLREGDYAYTGITNNPNSGALNTTAQYIHSFLTNPNLAANPTLYKEAMAFANKYGYDVSQGTQLSPYQKLTALEIATNNAKKQNVEFWLFQNPEVGKIMNQYLANTTGRTSASVYDFSNGMHAKVMSLEETARLYGYDSYQDLLKASTTQGIAKSDMLGTGAGSFKIQVYNKKANRNMDILVSPNEQQGHIFGASAHLGSPSYTGQHNAFYVVGFDDRQQIDYKNGYALDQDPMSIQDKDKRPPVVLRSNNIVTNMGSNGREQFATNVDVMYKNQDGEYVVVDTKSIDEIFENEMKYYTKTLNVPNKQNHAD